MPFDPEAVARLIGLQNELKNLENQSKEITKAVVKNSNDFQSLVAELMASGKVVADKAMVYDGKVIVLRSTGGKHIMFTEIDLSE